MVGVSFPGDVVLSCDDGWFLGGVARCLATYGRVTQYTVALVKALRLKCAERRILIVSNNGTLEGKRLSYFRRLR
jgi:hypothetical protein